MDRDVNSAAPCLQDGDDGSAATGGWFGRSRYWFHLSHGRSAPPDSARSYDASAMSEAAQGPGDAPAGPENIIQPGDLGGVWANFARVTHSEHEFTLDFIRMDYGEGRRLAAESWWHASDSRRCSFYS